MGLNAVIITVTGGTPRVLTVTRPQVAPDTDGGEPLDALPFGPLDPERDRTLELGLRRWVREQTGLELGYVEQLYTFGDRDRHPAADARVLSIAYLALVHESPPVAGVDARWQDLYVYVPWEDWREQRPAIIDRQVVPALEAWIGASGDPIVAGRRRERAAVTFGLSGAPWDRERVLERYELLYELGLVPEAGRDAGGGQPIHATSGPEAGRDAGGGQPVHVTSGPDDGSFGRPMVLDHRRIVATALGRLRGKLRYRPVVFELLPATFTLLQLQQVVEALSGVRLHKQNFRRLLERSRLVEGTGRHEILRRGRPAELFRFRREVLRERPAPGVGVPGGH
ncbi:MAG TPA: hypothetical protein VHF25_14235 [Nitriliruptorales bacterium]|nr:hypothetical protein [Nitriliruptorales bacterium]